jgi:hypothetical protein
MIRNNETTELCITKGQESHVAGWQSSRGPDGQLVLETLFVKLDKPAKDVKIDGLPLNVVPLTKISQSVDCIMPSGITLKVNQSQVPVLPNFSMTNYACQGETREYNVVDLNSCRSHGLLHYTI